MRTAIATGILLYSAGLSFAQDIAYRTVVLRGDAAPGTDPGTTFFSFEDPMIDDEGNTAFVATLFGAGVNSDNETGLWVERDGALMLVAREGFQAPGQPSGVVFDRIISPVLNRNGNTAFRAWLAGPGIDLSNRDSIWSETDGPGLGLVVQGGTHSGISGVDIGGFTTVRFGDNDLVTAKTFLAGATVNTTNDEAIIAQPTVGSPVIIAREGSQAAGTPSGVVYGVVEPNSVNDSGLIAFNGFVTGPGVDPTNNRGLWLTQKGGATSLVARGGDLAPGTGGDSYSAVGSPSLNSNGDLIFTASLVGPGVTFSNGSGVWRQAPGGTPQLFVRADTQSPGAPVGENHGVFFEPLVNAGGSAAFGGELIGATVQPLEKRAVWTEDLPSPLDLRLRGGDTSPDVPVDVLFSTINSPAFNGSGTFVVPALLTGPGITFNNRDVLVGKTIDGDARILARTGVMFDVDDDPNVTDMRLVLNPIQFVELSGGEDGRPTGLSENGQAAFTLNFQQTFSGVFVATFADSDCIADVNGDGMLTPTDFTAWINAFNNNLPECDQNADGSCTPTDFTAWIANYNLGC